MILTCSPSPLLQQPAEKGAREHLLHVKQLTRHSFILETKANLLKCIEFIEKRPFEN